ncbi:MAG TPA: hypothetical protein VF777_04345 [Phycisphaerales bacterium]
MTAASPQLRFDPAPDAWESLVRRGPIPSFARTFREQMGMVSDAPIVLSGHQAELWHPGILAKHLAAEAVAARVGGVSAWIVVDHDVPHELALRIPARDAEGRLVRKKLALLAEIDATRATGWIAPSASPSWSAADAALPALGARVDAIRAALDAAKGEKNWAAQVTAATQQLLPAGLPRLTPVFATRLQQTDLFRAAVRAMATDAAGAIASYNDAARLAPDAELRPLDGTKGELPLWRIDARGTRRRVLAAELSGAPTDSAAFDGLMPRALLMTALLRVAGCDLFIHGVGGFVYDRAMEQWHRSWLANALKPVTGGGAELAPMVLASATLRLPLEAKGVPEPGAIRAAVWRAHHARHDPGDASVGDAATAARKRELVAMIDARKKRGESSAAEFRALHDLLAAHRQKHARALDALANAAASLRAQSAQASVIDDRTWSFALQEPGAIVRLYEAVCAAFR